MKKYIPYGIIIVMAVVLFYSIERCTFNGRASLQNATALQDTVTYFANKMGTQTATIKALSVNSKQLEALVLQKDTQLAEAALNFAKVHTIVKFKTIAKVDTVYVAFEGLPTPDTLPQFNREGAVFDKWYSFNYKVNNNGLTLADLTMNTETAVVTGIKRKWFLGKETLVTDVSNTNPHITVTQLKAAEVKLPVPWYKKWYVWMAAGAVGGFFVAK
jgi:hypothetical protein